TADTTSASLSQGQTLPDGINDLFVGGRGKASTLAAEPFVPSRGDPAWNAGCDRHMAVHNRLDVIEETVEKTVEHLEAEVKGLLAQLEELAWNLPPGPWVPAPDLLGDDRFGAPEPELPSTWK
ncbi:placenta-specific protein 9, partial [Leptonychotes weddellii]|uniref:Placenta-specific protein 9 n=1 Tax=Leptonychotes weddellii TaxID=9713 RepID=A0A7F8QY09_LEPWE